MQLQQLPQASLVRLLRHFSRLAYFHFVLQIEKQKPPRNGWERGSTKPFSSFAQINFSSHASETNNFSKTTKKSINQMKPKSAVSLKHWIANLTAPKSVQFRIVPAQPFYLISPKFRTRFAYELWESWKLGRNSFWEQHVKSTKRANRVKKICVWGVWVCVWNITRTKIHAHVSK